MDTRFKFALLSSAAVAALTGTNAEAATQISPPTVSGYVSSGAICGIDVDVRMRGTGSETSNGEDEFQMLAFYSGTTLNFSTTTQFQSVPVGQVETRTFRFNYNPSNPIVTPANSIRFQVRDRDGAGFFSFLTPDLTITRADLLAAGGACANIANNQAPTANAGADAGVTGGSTVNVSGTANDADGDPITTQWTQISGPSVTLSNANTLNPSFVAPVQINRAQDIELQLAVSDGSTPVTDTVIYSVPAGPNTPPVANAGADTNVVAGANVTLDGSASSDFDSDPLTFSWTQLSGTPVTLSNAATAMPNFTAPLSAATDQLLVFELTVNDGMGGTTSDTVTITVPSNAAPVVDAGLGAFVNGGDTVTLQGSGSDADGDPLTYQWTQTAGPAVTLNGDTTLSPSFVAPPKTANDQILTFSLVGNDGTTNSAPSSVDVRVQANIAPVADDGGDQNVAGGQQAVLDGSGSTDLDDNQLTYSWTQISGPSVQITNGSTPVASFVAPAATGAIQTLRFQLIVADPLDAADSDIVEITVAANQQPLADAGTDQSVAGGDSVTLDGSASMDPDGDALTYAWTQTGGATVTLSDASSVSPTFVAPAAMALAQTLTFDLVVSDGQTSSVADSVQISIAANAPPVADAGADQGPINSGDVVTLDGTGSSDPDGDRLSYSWTQTAGPSVTLSDPTSATPTFTAPDVQGLQSLEFSLVVSDGIANSVADFTAVAVRGVGTITIIQRIEGEDTTVAFSSNVAQLDGSITTSGGVGQVSATSVAAGQYTISAADLTPSGYALTAISCNDSDSVTNLAQRSIALALSPNESLVCTFTSANTREAAGLAISNFLTGRNALLLSNQPDLQRRLDRIEGNAVGGAANIGRVSVPGSGFLPVALQLGSGSASFSTSLAMASGSVDPERNARNFDLWADVSFADVTIGQNRGRFMIGYLGADVLVSDDVLVGALLQLDQFDQDGAALGAAAAEGDGWMVGPYVTARLSENLFGDARVAWGQSDNTVSPLGTFVDGFDTERLLFSGSFVGDFALNKQTTFWPELSLRYIREHVTGYTDALGVNIPDQTVDQGELAFSPRIDVRLEASEHVTLRPYARVDGLLTFGSDATQVIGNGFRARIEGGADLLSHNGIRANVAAFIDGIGESEFEAIGLSLGVSFSF